MEINFNDIFVSKESQNEYFVCSIGIDVVVLSTMDKKHTFLVTKERLRKQFIKK